MKYITQKAPGPSAVCTEGGVFRGSDKQAISWPSVDSNLEFFVFAIITKSKCLGMARARLFTTQTFDRVQ